jgi:hypothetical protein
VIGHSSPSRRERLSRQWRTCGPIDSTLRPRPNIRIRSSTFAVAHRPHHLHLNVSDFTGSWSRRRSAVPSRRSGRSVRTACHQPSSTFVKCSGGHLACDGTVQIRNGKPFHQCYCANAGFISGTIENFDGKQSMMTSADTATKVRMDPAKQKTPISRLAWHYHSARTPFYKDLPASQVVRTSGGRRLISKVEESSTADHKESDADQAMRVTCSP